MRVSAQGRQIVSSNVGWYRSFGTTSGSILDTAIQPSFGKAQNVFRKGRGVSIKLR